MSEPQASPSSAARVDHRPVPFVSPGALRVPDESQFQVVLAAASTPEGLQDLRKMVAAWQSVAERCDVAFEELSRLATYRLEVERSLGAMLAQVVKAGGLRSRSHDGTLPRSGSLPEGVSKQQAERYRQLAAVPDSEFRAYLERKRASKELPTAAGLRRLVTLSQNGLARPRCSSRKGAAIELPPAVVDAINAIMLPDVVIGRSVVKGRSCVAPGDPRPLEGIRGDVFVAECPDPEWLLPRLKELRDKAVVSQVLVVLPAEVWADWFRMLEVGGWSFCFLAGMRTPDGRGLMLAHHGVRRAAFQAAAGLIGPTSSWGCG